MKFTQDLAVEYAENASISLIDDYVETDPYDGDHVVPGELRRFLASLRLLHGVPFSYLVPDADLLPPESIRFFYIDRNWTDAMVQGALSVGTITTTDRAQLETVYPQLRDEVDETERTIRVPDGEARLGAPGGTITGFLLRSRAVSGWPALHVRAYARDLLEDDALTTEAESNPERMKLLRMERLAPAVLLVLIDGVPAVVHIEEPRQGIQFGARMDTDAPPTARRAEVHLRDADHRRPARTGDEHPRPVPRRRAGRHRHALAARPDGRGRPRRTSGPDGGDPRVRPGDAPLPVPAGVRRVRGRGCGAVLRPRPLQRHHQLPGVGDHLDHPPRSRLMDRDLSVPSGRSHAQIAASRTVDDG